MSAEAACPAPKEAGYVDFIYGGPWISDPPEAPIVNSSTPRNVQLRGIYKWSFAYKTLKDRLPVILTKVVDTLSRSGGDAAAIQEISKLKNELVTNKRIEPLPETSEEAKYWNRCIEAMDEPYYFTTIWLYSECYVYRRLKEAVQSVDPFEEQKREAFAQNLEASCVSARKLMDCVNTDTDKDSIVTLLKLCLWANKCDLSLSGGADAEQIVDPVEMITKLTANLLVDDTDKIADLILDKCRTLQKKIDEKEDERGEESKPCPSKITRPDQVTIDIVCDNAGYELVTDLCLGYFLLKKHIAKKVRYHVKAMPWFVSDVTPKDFDWVVSQCGSADYTRELPRKGGKDLIVTSEHLQTLGLGMKEFLESGDITVESDAFWTTPTLYKDMKRMDEAMYRKLQFAVVVVFKGDLNYRKLVGENNWPPTTSFEAALQGFIPAPVVAVRTVKADLIAGLPKGKWEELTKQDEHWMEKGDYGVIQLCAKRE